MTKRWIVGSIVIFLILLGSITYASHSQSTTSSPIPTAQVAEDITQPTPEPAAITDTQAVAIPTPSAKVQKSDRQKVTVVNVTDGDTFKVLIDGKTETVRIVGIDTPETVDPRKSVQCFGKEASDYSKQLLQGKTMYLETDKSQADRDHYQRLLRFVFFEDGSDFGLSLIRDGYAHEFTYNSNPYIYQSAYLKAQTEARENNRGLWNANACLYSTPTPTPKSFTKTTTKTTTSAGGHSCTGPDLDCADFKTHGEAQSFFDGCGFTTQNDPMKLDSVGVGDGVACESLP